MRIKLLMGNRFGYLIWASSASFLSICSLRTLLAFSRHKTLSLNWFSRTLRASRDFFAARLFFLKNKNNVSEGHHSTSKYYRPPPLPVLVILLHTRHLKVARVLPGHHVGAAHHAGGADGLGHDWVVSPRYCGISRHITLVTLTVGT